MSKKVFLIVLDSFGIGNAPDAADFGDEGSNTLAAVEKSSLFRCPNMQKLGLFNIDGVQSDKKVKNPIAAYARLEEVSRGKDTTIGHWEIAGIESEEPLPTFEQGFPASIINEFAKITGRQILCNKPYSGTQVIKEYGEEHLKTGALIVYTSADSVFQIAANEAIVPIEDLYDYCRMARSLLKNEYAVGRVIARPFTGTNKENFTRTANRHDFSLAPPKQTMLDIMLENKKEVIAVGKINDIFAGRGISEFKTTKSNKEGMETTLEYAQSQFEGLCFVNLVDFDMLYGHRNDVDGYAAALSEFDDWLGKFIAQMKKDDLLLITADHGCDPSTPSTDHSRECVPLLMYGANICAKNLNTVKSFSSIAKTVCAYFGLPNHFSGQNLFNNA